MSKKLSIKSPQDIIDAVTNGDDKIISELLHELNNKMKHSLLQQGMELRDIEEVLLDSMTIFIQKVRKKEFEDRGVPVIAYLIKVAKIRSYQILKRRKWDIVPINDEILTQCNGELTRFEDWDRVKLAMEKLPINQKKLIEFTYFKNISDSEILENNLTPYTSIESLRTQRHKAIKKLCELLNSKG